MKLAPREYALLRFFARHADQLYTREQLLAFVWRRSRGLGKRTVDVHVRRLRQVLEPFGCDGYLQTVRSEGYRFGPRETDEPIPASLAPASPQRPAAVTKLSQ